MSKLLETAYEMALSLYEVGAMDKQTFDEVEELCYGDFDNIKPLNDEELTNEDQDD